MNVKEKFTLSFIVVWTLMELLIFSMKVLDISVGTHSFLEAHKYAT